MRNRAPSAAASTARGEATRERRARLNGQFLAEGAPPLGRKALGEPG